jgi:nicotinamide mononucleotide transporter
MARQQPMPATAPTAMAPSGLTAPQAGVMATRPATAPEAAPKRLGWPRNTHSPKVQASVAAAAAIVVCQWAFSVIGAGWPAPRWYYWCDAWIFVGSMVATYAMARGWNDFWLAWIAVDLVGVPLLWHSGYYPTAILFVVYGALVVWGFLVWRRAARDETPTGDDRQAVSA